jgi:AraC-like DNA-binding protein
MEAMSSGFLMAHTRLIPFALHLRMCLGPLIYFYTRSLIYGDRKITGKDYLHFLPLVLDMQPQLIFLLSATGILSIPFVQHFYFLPTTQGFLFRSTIVDNMPSFCSFAIYTGLCYQMVRSELRNTQLSAYKMADVKWLKKLIHLVCILIIIWLITIVWSYVSGWNRYFLYIPSTVFIYWLGMSTYFRQSKMTESDVEEYNKPPLKIYFSDDEAQHYNKQLIGLMETEQLYLNATLKMDVLAERLTLNERSISNLLNQHLGKSFNDFINEYRVQEAKKKLADPAFKQFTIAAIAFDCGFNSLATFQRCFKQFTGSTPSQYLKAVEPAVLSQPK